MPVQGRAAETAMHSILSSRQCCGDCDAIVKAARRRLRCYCQGRAEETAMLSSRQRGGDCDAVIKAARSAAETVMLSSRPARRRIVILSSLKQQMIEPQRCSNVVIKKCWSRQNLLVHNPPSPFFWIREGILLSIPAL